MVLGICVQISRQAFQNEFGDYINCALDYLVANVGNGTPFTQKDVNQVTELKKKLNSMKSH